MRTSSGRRTRAKLINAIVAKMAVIKFVIIMVVACNGAIAQTTFAFDDDQFGIIAEMAASTPIQDIGDIDSLRLLNPADELFAVDLKLEMGFAFVVRTVTSDGVRLGGGGSVHVTSNGIETDIANAKGDPGVWGEFGGDTFQLEFVDATGGDGIFIIPGIVNGVDKRGEWIALVPEPHFALLNTAIACFAVSCQTRRRKSTV